MSEADLQKLREENAQLKHVQEQYSKQVEMVLKQQEARLKADFELQNIQ